MIEVIGEKLIECHTRNWYRFGEVLLQDLVDSIATTGLFSR